MAALAFLPAQGIAIAKICAVGWTPKVPLHVQDRRVDDVVDVLDWDVAEQLDMSVLGLTVTCRRG
jgi:hypothetical protein